MSSTLSLEEIRNLEAPTEDFLCKPEDNTYGIEFVYFKIRNANNNQVLFEIRKPESEIGKKAAHPVRFVQYQFGPNFFKLSTIGTTLEFRVGPQPVKKFLMIEKHYFKGMLIKSYEFEVPFCMPNSQNSLEAVYELPQFGPELEEEMIKSPFETVSDSFYFVEGKLVMHNKAAYSYAPFQ